MIKEMWKLINKYPKYEISSYGEFRRTITLKSVKKYKSKRGYELVRIYNNDGGKTFNVHTLVANAFIKGSECCITCGCKLEINHKDENPSNNRADNLSYITRQQNIEYSKTKKEENQKIYYNRCMNNGINIFKNNLG